MRSVPDVRLTLCRIGPQPERYIIYWSSDRRSDACRVIRRWVFDQELSLTYRDGEAMVAEICREQLFQNIAKHERARP